MRNRVVLLSLIAVTLSATLGWADDEVYVRSKDKPYKGAIKIRVAARRGNIGGQRADTRRGDR